MPLIGNCVKSKKTGKSGLSNRIYQPFYDHFKKYAKISTEKVSLSTGLLWDTPDSLSFYHCYSDNNHQMQL